MAALDALTLTDKQRRDCVTVADELTKADGYDADEIAVLMSVLLQSDHPYERVIPLGVATLVRAARELGWPTLKPAAIAAMAYPAERALA